MPVATASGEELPQQGGRKLFFDLIFLVTFFIKKKSNSPPRQLTGLTLI
jgi:hypothetical protein